MASLLACYMYVFIVVCAKSITKITIENRKPIFFYFSSFSSSLLCSLFSVRYIYAYECAQRTYSSHLPLNITQYQIEFSEDSTLLVEERPAAMEENKAKQEQRKRFAWSGKYIYILLLFWCSCNNQKYTHTYRCPLARAYSFTRL